MKQKTPYSLYAYGTGIICKCERALAWVQRSKEHILESFLFLGRRRQQQRQRRSNDWTRISTLRRRVKECARVTLWCLDNKCAKHCTEKYEHILTTLIYNITLPANNESTPWYTMAHNSHTFNAKHAYVAKNRLLERSEFLEMAIVVSNYEKLFDHYRNDCKF